MMKMKRILFFLLFLMSAFCFAQKVDSDIQIYNEIRQNFSNGFYPGTVTAADELQKSFPESSFIPSALAYKGEALIYMESYDEALAVLQDAVSHMHSGSPEIIRCYYLLGQAFYVQKKYQQALEKYHLACSLALTNNDLEFYSPSVLGAGLAFYELENWKEASPLFEYVVSNGKLFDAADYSEAMQKLFICYNKDGQASKTVSLFNKLSQEDFEPAVYFMLCFYYGDACVSLGKNSEAYEAYSRVLEQGEKPLPGVDKFILRLAIDEFNARNFDKAEQYLSDINEMEAEENEEIRFFRQLYRAKIQLERGMPAAAEKELSGLETLAKKLTVEGASDSYYSTLLQCKIQNEKWEELPGIYGKIKEPGAEDRYAVSSYYYKKGQFDKVDPSCGELYASALCKSGNYEKACAEYARLNSLSLDYALALFYCGSYDQAEKVAAAGKAAQKDYFRGLCFINLKKWKQAAEAFAVYMRQNSSAADFNILSYYYKGYAEYNLAEFKNSYSSFVRYCMEEQNVASSKNSSSYLLRGYEYAVKAALQSGDFKNASLQAANLVRYSPEGEQKQRAVVLSAEILTDYESYDDAIELLAPYTSGRTEFAAQSIFMTAKIYERQNKISQADELYRRIYENLPKTSYAEEAMYRCGEVFYSQGDYSKAYSRFNNYIYKYTSGKFGDAASFYCADCALRLGELDRCVMLNKNLLQKYPASVYAYGANKNLLEAYYKQEEYSQALTVARGMQRDFAVQAAEDDISKRVKELEKIVGGVDRRIAEKESEFSKLGGVSTVAGRAVGSELVRFYAESLSTQGEAYELAFRILDRQNAVGLSEERADMAYNSEFIAEYSRRNGDNKRAAQMYLKAAELFRSVKNDSGAAAALYGAAEAFTAEGLRGDARETAALLKELYPQSIQAERVDRVTGDARN